MATTSPIEELEAALAAGTSEQRMTMLMRVTDLFIDRAGSYSERLQLETARRVFNFFQARVAAAAT